MGHVQAIRATRYGIAVEGSALGALDSYLSPPYDVISPAEREALVATSATNSVLLDLPERRSGDAADAPFLRAAERWQKWRADGTLLDDAAPCIYLYEERPASGRTIRGIFAGIPVGPYGSQTGILRHEATLDGPKAERRALIASVQANLSPVILLRAGGHEAFAAAADAVTSAPTCASGVTPSKSSYRIWQVAPESDHGAALLSWANGADLVIADGHHRYETARDYAERGGGLAVALGLIVESDHCAPALYATHRIVAAPDPIALIARLSASPLVTHHTTTTSEQLAARFADGAPESAELEIGVVTHSGAALLRLDRAAISAALPGRSTAYQTLSVTALAVLLDQSFGIDAAAAAAGALRYVRGAEQAISSALADPTPSAVLLLHGEHPEQVVAVAEAGETMPQKSTLFAPKPPTGLLFLAHEINRVG
jgi:uncharacterized protein (DUF1015 family)